MTRRPEDKKSTDLWPRFPILPVATSRVNAMSVRPALEQQERTANDRRENAGRRRREKPAGACSNRD